MECKNCVYFVRDRDVKHCGWCHRSPPTYTAKDESEYIYVHESEDWCGEFKGIGQN